MKVNIKGKASVVEAAVVGASVSGQRHPEVEMVRRDALVFLPRFLMREKLNEAHIANNLLPKLQEDEGVELDAIEVTILTDGQMIVTDGFHRGEAYRLAEREYIPAVVQSGSMQDATDRALANNPKHGLLLTEADKRVKFKVFWEEYSEEISAGRMSNREIARRTNLPILLVGTLVDEMIEATGVVKPETKTVTRGGVQYTMTTKRIGATRNRPDIRLKLPSELAAQLRAIAETMTEPYYELRGSLLRQIPQQVE